MTATLISVLPFSVTVVIHFSCTAQRGSMASNIRLAQCIRFKQCIKQHRSWEFPLPTWMLAHLPWCWGRLSPEFMPALLLSAIRMRYACICVCVCAIVCLCVCACLRTVLSLSYALCYQHVYIETTTTPGASDGYEHRVEPLAAAVSCCRLPLNR